MGEGGTSGPEKKTNLSAFYRFRLKWMPFANLTVVAIAIFIIMQLPFVAVHIIEPAADPSAPPSAVVQVSNPVSLRVYIEETLGCDYDPATIQALAKPKNGSVINMGELSLDKKEWVASNVELPLGEYTLDVSVEADCRKIETISSSMNINVVCSPLTVAQAKAQGDVCGDYVADNCGGYVKLPSCIDFGAKDPRLGNENLDCAQTGYYVGKSNLTYKDEGETRHYYAALKCGSGNNTECYAPPSQPGSCRSSRTPEPFSFYGDKDDPVYHKCRFECRKK